MKKDDYKSFIEAFPASYKVAIDSWQAFTELKIVSAKAAEQILTYFIDLLCIFH